MKEVWPVHILIACLVFVSCSAPVATPTINMEEVQSTAMSAALSAVAETQAAFPTRTPIQPTNTLTETPIPTLTLEPSPTSVPTATATSTRVPCNQPLTSWNVPSTTFSVVNETKPKGKITLSLTALTAQKECGYLVINGDSFSGPVGSYGAFAYVDGDKDFTVSGSFYIKEVPYKIIVRNDKIIEAYSCYPHC